MKGIFRSFSNRRRSSQRGGSIRMSHNPWILANRGIYSREYAQGTRWNAKNLISFRIIR
jgi:hypothetical protein